MQAGVASHLPPLPSSLGSVSGRRSTPSGYTPRERPTVPQPRGRGGDNGGLVENRPPMGGPARSSSSRQLSGSTPGTAGHSAGYVNAGSGEQRTRDLYEGPDQPPGHSHMGGVGDAGGPPIPARDLEMRTPARPSRPHPGRRAPRSFHDLGARAYSAYGEYEIQRMIAYRHLNLSAPPINVPPTITDENRDRRTW